MGAELGYCLKIRRGDDGGYVGNVIPKYFHCMQRATETPVGTKN
jgi:hypothetical protein